MSDDYHDDAELSDAQRAAVAQLTSEQVAAID
jgi:hypothetical protein